MKVDLREQEIFDIMRLLDDVSPWHGGIRELRERFRKLYARTQLSQRFERRQARAVRIVEVINVDGCSWCGSTHRRVVVKRRGGRGDLTHYFVCPTNHRRVSVSFATHASGSAAQDGAP